MAIPNKPFFLPLLALITIFLTLLNRVNSSDSLSFTFNNFRSGEKNLIFQGDTSITSSNTLQLTKTDRRGVPQKSTVGRALFSAQVRLWDRNTRSLASFESTFTFSLRSPLRNPADGFAFFIAPPETTIPARSTGGLLGLFRNALNSTANQVVAVEFDTFFAQDSNTWDPNYTHIGIDVNSIRSSAVTRWDRREGAIGIAHIIYNAATRRLAVTSSYPGSATYSVVHDIDLSTVLPEWVRVGFSAASGQQYQVHTIHSWFFSSKLDNTKATKEDTYIASVV